MNVVSSLMPRLRRLAVIHITVLCLIALLALLRQVAIQNIMQEQASSGMALSLLGPQQILSQQITKDVLVLETVNDPAVQQTYRQELRINLAKWLHAQQKLEQLRRQGQLSNARQREAVEQYLALKPDYDAIQTLAQKALSSNKTESGELKAEIVQTLLPHERHYLAQMASKLQSYYQTSALYQITLQVVETVCFVLTLIVLLLEVFVVFRPIMKRLFQILKMFAKTMESLRINEERIRSLLSHAPVVLFALDMQGVFTFIEGQNLEAIGIKAEHLLGKKFAEIYAQYPVLHESAGKAISGQAVQIVAAFGPFVFETVFSPVYDVQNIQTGVIGVSTDITERVRAEERLQHQRLHDALTDLPNRNLLNERLEAHLQSSCQESSALLLLDLDHFKDINDTYGHQYGDLLLQQVAERLQTLVCEHELVARLGGDEFALLLPGVGGEQVQERVQDLKSALESPFSVAEHQLHIRPSIGVALAPEHGSDAHTLLRCADVAMYRAKQTREEYVIHDVSYEQESVSRLALLGALRYAIERQQMQLYYQPKVLAESGGACGVEALIRWQHPVYGFVAPDKFIPLAEHSGMITGLTHWVLETALKQCSQWRAQGIHLTIAVNLSMCDLQDTLLPERIAALLKRHHVPAHQLHLELTESAVMRNAQEAMQTLQKLHELGLRIAIDDFGTGYSSLAYLKRLPVDELKIDRSFVQHMANVKEDALIVQSTIALGHSLGLRVVAEGVEDYETWQLLAALGCDTMQGYYFSRPLAAEVLERWLEEATLRIA